MAAAPRATGWWSRRPGTAGTRGSGSPSSGCPRSARSRTSAPASPSAALPEGNYRLDPARGGGALYDVGCYAVSACLWAVGRGLPDDVAAQVRAGPTGVDLDVRAVLRLGRRRRAPRCASGIDADEGQWLVVTGERGEIELRDAPYTSWKDDDTELGSPTARGTERVPVPATDAYRVMVEEVSSVLAGRARLGAAAGGVAADRRRARRRAARARPPAGRPVRA